jgi:hypothetical protein
MKILGSMFIFELSFNRKLGDELLGWAVGTLVDSSIKWEVTKSRFKAREEGFKMSLKITNLLKAKLKFEWESKHWNSIAMRFEIYLRLICDCLKLCQTVSMEVQMSKTRFKVFRILWKKRKTTQAIFESFKTFDRRLRVVVTDKIQIQSFEG